jgi:hypothetical protein
MTIAADAFGGSSSTPRGGGGSYSAQWSPPLDYTTTNTLPTAPAAAAAGLCSNSSSALSISDALCGSAGWTATAAVAGRRQQQQSPMLVSSGSSSNTLYHSSSSGTLYNSCSEQSPVELLQLQQQQQQRSHDRVHSYADAMHDALTGGTGNSTAAATGSGISISAMEDCDGLLRIGSGSFRRSASGSSFAYDSMDWYVHYQASSSITYCNVFSSVCHDAISKELYCAATCIHTPNSARLYCAL